MLTSRPAPLTASRPLHARTPGKALQKARGILQENALQAPRTAKTLRVQLQTPLKGSSRKAPKEVQSSKAIVNSVVRPLGDKTPFSNRQRLVVQDPTPGPAKANLPVQDENLGLWTPGHALLASSVRMTVRGRHSSGTMFKTPDTSGNHWDVVEGDVIAPVAPELQGEEAESEDYDEIEYMPPTAKDPPFAPHFDVPEYKLMGMQLSDMMHSYWKDDAIDRFYAAEKENIDDAGLLEASGFSSSPSQWHFFELPQDDDSTPFAQLRGPKPSVEHVTSGPFRARAATIDPRKRPPVHLPSKRGQAMRAGPTPMAGSAKKLLQINLPTRPATATGRMAPTSRIGSVSTSRMHARPATSVSLRPPTAVARAVRLSTKSQTDAKPLVADPEIVLEFEGVESDVGNDDFMFDV